VQVANRRSQKILDYCQWTLSPVKEALLIPMISGRLRPFKRQDRLQIASTFGRSGNKLPERLSITLRFVYPTSHSHHTQQKKGAMIDHGSPLPYPFTCLKTPTSSLLNNSYAFWLSAGNHVPSLQCLGYPFPQTSLIVPRLQRIAVPMVLFP
jgi:hypothetical protein